MKRINKITLVQFRNYNSASFTFSEDISCITGPNGSGKTNLLDSVYYLCYTKSYFSAWQHNSVQKGTDGFRLEGAFEKNDREETIVCRWKQGKKEISVDGVDYEKITDHIGRYAAVMIAPDDMELINEGSELRRKWVDGILSQADKEYLERLIRYQKVLAQRNAWLKLNYLNPPSASPELDFYNSQLAADGSYIYMQRKKFSGDFIPILAGVYEELSGGKEQVSLSYESQLDDRPLAEWLQYSFQNDLRLQRTSKGIHRDDWSFLLEGGPLKQFGSQGQKKSFLFAMKLAQYSYLDKALGHRPILLLDDIFEKLDQKRMEALLRIIRGPEFGQVILTDTHAERVEQAFGGRAGIGFISLS